VAPESLSAARTWSRRVIGGLPAALLVAGMATATYSVVRYRFWIVAVYTVLTALLAAWVFRGRTPRFGTKVIATALGATAVAALNVTAYSGLSPAGSATIRLASGTAAVIAALAVLLWPRRGADLALGVSVAAFLGNALALIQLNRAPRIDVWIILQQASDTLGRAENVYTQVWKGSPGIQDAFTYLPWTAVLLAPGRWLLGDVRWMLVAVTLLTALTIRTLPGPAAPTRRQISAAGAAALLLLLPGTATQVEQAWTEPLLLACLAGWAFGVRRGSTVLAVVALALGLASKQHLALLLPVLAAWPGFGPRKAAASVGLAGALVLPWLIASPADMWHDTVSLLVSFPPLKFADTLYIAARNELGWTPPLWLTGAIVIGTVATVAWVVHRRDPDLGEVLRWCALVLLVANLVNKQAFYNQYWLVAGLIITSWAVPPRRRRRDEVSSPPPADQPAAPAA
jgi:hypothetical protein